MITRVGIEANGTSQDHVRDQLIVAASDWRDLVRGQWQDDSTFHEQGMQIIQTKTGYWGHYTIKRIDNE